jgi:tRNA(Ile)-lysidine synthase TilS/MesJ
MTLLKQHYYQCSNGAEVKTMLPKLHSDNFEGIDLIRPLCLVKEESIISWKNYNELTFINCACKFTENCSIDDSASKRKEIKELIKSIRKINPNVDDNLYKSMENVNLNCILGGHKDNKKYSFLDDFNNQK